MIKHAMRIKQPFKIPTLFLILLFFSSSAAVAADRPNWQTRFCENYLRGPIKAFTAFTKMFSSDPRLVLSALESDRAEASSRAQTANFLEAMAKMSRVADDARDQEWEQLAIEWFRKAAASVHWNALKPKADETVQQVIERMVEEQTARDLRWLLRKRRADLEVQLQVLANDGDLADRIRQIDRALQDYSIR